MATQIAERTADPIQVFRQTISRPAFREQLKMALPSHIPVERFERVSLTAVQNNPDLLDGRKVERHSLFGALVKAAQDGLLPDGREGAIVPFRGRAQWMPMVAGIMKKVRNSGEIASWDAFAVFEKDEFERLLGDDMRIHHKPYDEGDPGPVIGAYSIVTFKDGSRSKDYLPRWRIEKAREQNPVGKNSLMWTKFYDEGAIKTVIRHHSKRLPMATDIEAVFERDESMTPAVGDEEQFIEKDVHEPASRLDALEYSIDTPNDGTLSEENPPADDQRGEAHTDAPTTEGEPAWAGMAQVTRSGIVAAKNLSYLKSVMAEFDKHRAVLPDDVLDEIDGLATARRKALAEAEGA